MWKRTVVEATRLTRLGHRVGRRRMMSVAVAAAVAVVACAAVAKAPPLPIGALRSQVAGGATSVAAAPVNIAAVVSSEQLVTLPAPASSGTPLMTATAGQGTDQGWAITTTGYVDSPTLPGIDDSLVQMPLVQISSQQNEQLCLDADGRAGALVDVTSCAPTQTSQPDQLWILAGAGIVWTDRDTGASQPSFNYLATPLQEVLGHAPLAVVLINYASVVDQDNDLTKAQIMSTAAANQADSPLSLQPEASSFNGVWTTREPTSDSIVTHPASTPEQSATARKGR